MSAMLEDIVALKEESLKIFQCSLVPTVNPETVIGVRVPALKNLAKKYKDTEEGQAFLRQLPHRYFEEISLHIFLINEIKDYETCIDEIERILPYIDNWATCDGLRPKILAKHKTELMQKIDEWIESGETYRIRFGVNMLMTHFLEKDFQKEYLEKVASIHSEEYYVKMVVAWYFATAIAKQYDFTISYIKEYILDTWTHNKTIQKSCESFRVSEEHKTELRSYRVKNK